jgi:hypothetical protein
MQLQTNHYYDDETMKFVAAKWFVDGEEVSFDEYMDIVGGLEEYNEIDKDIDKDCNDECEEVVCYNECESCEIPDEICEEINLIEEVAEMIENGDMCATCLRNNLYELYVEGKNVGWNDYKDYMQECIDTSVSDEE